MAKIGKTREQEILVSSKSKYITLNINDIQALYLGNYASSETFFYYHYVSHVLFIDSSDLNNSEDQLLSFRRQLDIIADVISSANETCLSQIEILKMKCQ